MTRKLLVTSLVVLSSVAVVRAEEEQTVADLTAKPVHVAMFKNGVGLVIAQIELPDPAGQYRVRSLPDATLGSFWVSWPGSLALTDIKATQAQSTEKVPAASIQELLEANIGRTVDLKIRDGWQRVKIVDIPDRHDEPVIQPHPKNVIPPPPPPGRGDLLLIEDGIGVRAVPLGWVQEVRLDSEEPHYLLKRPKLENVLEFSARPAERRTARRESWPVSITYLAQGIAWSPSYVVDISKEETATISAKAVIVNDLIPLEHTDVELIAGFPHIEFGTVKSAFTLTPLRQILEQVRRGGREEREMLLSNVLAQSTVYAGAAVQPSMPPTPVMGESAEDLYFYEIKDITLKKGERGYYPLFAGEIAYEHLYTWDIPDYIDREERYQSGQAEAPQVVWHSLKLTNTTGNPWTTAPAITMKDGRVLGQDTINYTPDKASSELRITQAVSIAAEQNEYETERERNAATFYDRAYDLVTISGELAVTNYKDKPITLKITKTLSGEVGRADGKPKITKMARGLRRVNPRSQLVWRLEVEPGREKAVTLNYTYRVYIRS